MRTSILPELGESLKTIILPLAVVIATVLQLSSVSSGAVDLLATPTATATPTPTATLTPTATVTPTSTPTATLPATATPTSTTASTSTPTPTPTPAPSLTLTFTPSPTPTSTSTSTSTSTLTPTPTPTPTSTPTPLPTPDGVEREARVPILMYHHISAPPLDADDVRRDLSVSPRDFDEQLRYLRKAGYHSITLRDLIYYLAIGKRLPRKPVVLTFDDGYQDMYTHAYRLLKRHGFVGTFFLITAPIDQENEEYLSWDQVKEMSADGMEFEPHTYTHPDLREQPVDYIVWQVMAAKEAIEERTGKTARFLSYPSGMYDQQVVDILLSAYFWGAVTTNQSDRQSSQQPFELSRIRIRGGDTLNDFVVKLHLDWETEIPEDAPPFMPLMLKAPEDVF